MILSHEHRFIFLKTRKTAGTSIEIALSKFCGDKDIITRITKQDEVLRSQLGFRGPQNFLVRASKYDILDILRIVRDGRLRINNHDPASLLTKYIDKENFEEYHKFTVVRNPWDMAVSMYYWQVNGPSKQFSNTMSFKDFINYCPRELLDNSLIYLIDGESIIDTFIKFENFSYEATRLIISGLVFIFAYLLHRKYSFKDYKKIGVAIYANSVENLEKILELQRKTIEPVSYTHLTLPTNREV